MIIILERHKYAPELNQPYIVKNGSIHKIPLTARQRAKGFKTIKDVKKALFAPIEKPFIHATFKTEFPAPYEYLNKTQSGRVQTRSELIAFKNAHVEKNRYGEFIDMSHSEYVESYTMPIPKITLTTKLIG